MVGHFAQCQTPVVHRNRREGVAVWTCGVCRSEFDELEIGPHLLAMHPREAKGIELWPDGGMVCEVFPADWEDADDHGLR